MLLFHNLPESFPIHLTGRPSFKDLYYAIETSDLYTCSCTY